jgi:hypothetical protein
MKPTKPQPRRSNYTIFDVQFEGKTVLLSALLVLLALAGLAVYAWHLHTKAEFFHTAWTSCAEVLYDELQAKGLGERP